MANGQPGGPQSAAAQALLAANGFAVEPATLPQPYGLYADNKRVNVPSFVTSDLLLHVYHVLYDYTLRDLEARRFASLLGDLTSALMAASAAQLGDAPATVRDDVQRNVAYLASPSRRLPLLFSECVLPGTG